MHRVRVVHWKPEDVRDEVERLRATGYEVDDSAFDGPPAMKALRERPPAAVVIDLARVPSRGRDVGLWLRQTKSTRGVPIVFAGGDPEKVTAVRALLPDAVYTSWRSIGSALARGIRNPPHEPVRPGSVMAGYSGTPLPKKLGIKPGVTVLTVRAPDDFAQTLGTLPEGARLWGRLQGRCDLVIWFVRSRRELEGKITKMAAATPADGMWIAWPKLGSGAETDLTQTVVRKAGLASGLVDYKICAIDETWSGLKFAVRK